MIVTQKMIDAGAEAILSTSLAQAMELREVEARIFAEKALLAVARMED